MSKEKSDTTTDESSGRIPLSENLLDRVKIIERRLTTIEDLKKEAISSLSGLVAGLQTAVAEVYYRIDAEEGGLIARIEKLEARLGWESFLTVHNRLDALTERVYKLEQAEGAKDKDKPTSEVVPVRIDSLKPGDRFWYEGSAKRYVVVGEWMRSIVYADCDSSKGLDASVALRDTKVFRV